MATTTGNEDTEQLVRLFRLDTPVGENVKEPPTAEAVESFYRLALAHQDLAPHFADVDVEHLKAALLRHWDALFASVEPDALAETFVASTRVGHVHVDAGVDTTTYLAGYAALLEDLVVGLSRRRMKDHQREAALRTILRHSFADIAASLHAHHGESSARDAADRLRALSDSLEREITTTLSEAQH